MLFYSYSGAKKPAKLMMLVSKIAHIDLVDALWFETQTRERVVIAFIRQER